MDGSILVANVDGVEYIKFQGIIRYSHCGGLEAHIDALFESESEPDLDIAIDLIEAEILDSTALGLLARIAIEQKKFGQKMPVIFLQQGELYNIIKRVCFDQVFELVFAPAISDSKRFEKLVAESSNEKAVLMRVVRAHRSLAEVSETNQSLFRDITQVIDQQ